MKKGKVKSLIAVVMVGVLMLSGCTNSGSKASSKAQKYTIGISQLSEHPALDDARLGFIDGLKELGVDAEIIYQNAQGEIPNTLSIAQKFVKDEVDLIYAIATPAAQSAKQATDDIPVLFSAVTDPVKSGIVQDWNNVGGNVTGTSDLAPTKSQLQMFEQIDPNIKKIGILYNTGENNSEVQIDEVKSLAPDEGLEITTVGVTNTNEIPQALDSLLKKVDAVYILSDNLVASSVELVSKKLVENKMISVSAEETQVRGGILITNGLSYYELGKQTAQMAKEILIDKKDVPTIPVGIAEKTINTVNIKTLKDLGLNENLEIFKNAEKVGN
ncbi:ABC transporter substrate-binding protein [Paratissierella segnis]|jgi:putative ABC transport system substrate-binding protein|uniref:ABC transporter substrate-binding protein n=1 Tax=Paratissierella segnis TaxID=2763679 RepID=A0A926IE19_9FIRM|nr:ABC transporter substrate-binding protein [Paratissierella segnis]MBC8586887.1 ABC transporter substrate-binding protein [Paratissierella segnis]